MGEFESRFIAAEDGLRLHFRDYASSRPAQDRLPVVCLPGLSRNCRDFHALALLVRQDPVRPRRVISLDYRGRGLSGYDPDPANYNLGVECRDVLTVLATLRIGEAIFIGTSRGGLILHILASLKPEVLAGAVLNDIGPAIEPNGLREIRDYLRRRPSPRDRTEAAEALKVIHSPSFPALTQSDWLDMADALYIDRGSNLAPDFDPRLTQQLEVIDFSKPLPTLWPQFPLLAKRPLLAIRGETSRLLSMETHVQMAEVSAAVETMIANGQGHAPLLHLPDVYQGIQAFLARLD